MESKACKKCGEVKGLDEFYRHKQTLDGRLGSCIKCFRAAEKRRRADNPEAIRARDRAYWAAHPDSKRAKDARYKAAHRSEHAESASKWNREHPERFKTHLYNNYARRNGVEPGHTYEQWQAKLAMAGGRCVMCGSEKNITRDHIIPLAAGGSDSIDNIQPLCRSCNTRKANQRRESRKSSA